MILLLTSLLGFGVGYKDGLLEGDFVGIDDDDGLVVGSSVVSITGSGGHSLSLHPSFVHTRFWSIVGTDAS